MDVIELNEAFAAQALAVIREWKVVDKDHERTNAHGPGISGHPVGATGVRMFTALARELARREQRFGLETMCFGAGLGMAAVFERVVWAGVCGNVGAKQNRWGRGPEVA